MDIEESTREEVEEEVRISRGAESESGTAESIEGEPQLAAEEARVVASGSFEELLL